MTDSINLITSLGVVGEKTLDTFKRELADAKRKEVDFILLPTKHLARLIAVAEAARNHACHTEYCLVCEALDALEADP